MVDTLLPGAVLLVYALVNGSSFIAYYRDKKLAERNIWRTPEKTLLVLALVGPFGALAAMRAFRHKTQKAKFRLVPLFLCLHLVLFAALALGFA
jgi:Predicted membrane protein